jgi:Ca2+-binding RTX toxin-like protein
MPVINSTNSIFRNDTSNGFVLTRGDVLSVWADGQIQNNGGGRAIFGGIPLGPGPDFSLEIDGYVSAINQNGASAVAILGASFVTVGSNGRVFASTTAAGHAMELFGNTTFRNNGSINCVGGDTVVFNGGVIQFTNGLGGSIKNNDDNENAILFNGCAEVNGVNNGYISTVESFQSTLFNFENYGQVFRIISNSDSNYFSNSMRAVIGELIASGETRISNSGKIVLARCGDGNDSLDYRQSNSVDQRQRAELGGGNDVFDGSNLDETVDGGLGSDTIRLNGGDDVFLARAGAGDGLDRVDAGLGTDIYITEASDLISASVIVNIDTINHGSALAQRATGFDIGTDVLIGFENVRTSEGNDQIHGSGSVNSLVGRGGNDAIWGYAGNDSLEGSSGNDYLRGGRGADRLFGGVGSDGFVFDTAAISAEADGIFDFAAVDDSIWLDNAIFPLLGAGGVLNAAFFKAFTATTQLDSNDLVAYQTTTGRLYVDMNGAAAGGWAQIAGLSTNLGITAADFIVF